MNFNLVGAPGLLLLLPLLWWGIVLYLALRFLRAFERGVRAHEDVARELRLQGMRRETRDPQGGTA